MNEQQLVQLRAAIKTIPDYPIQGILFRDVTSLLEDADAFSLTMNLLANKYKNQGFTKVVGTEARGFLFGAPLALALGIGFVPVRKPGKLPRETFEQSYQLEYGEDVLELHTDAIVAGDKVLLVDDLLATGGTIEATYKLVERLGGKATDAAFVVSLPELGGEDKMKDLGINILKLVEFEGE